MIAAGMVTFSLLWMIFKPGDLLLEHMNGHTRLFRVRRHGYGESRIGGRYLDINSTFTSYDGVRFGTASDTLRIWDRKEFFGLFSTPITSLSVFPLKFLGIEESSTIQHLMVERGRRYMTIRDCCVMQYHGLFLYLKRPPWNFYNEDANYDGTFLPETMSGRVVIDPKTFNEEARARKEELAENDSDDEDKTKIEYKPCMVPFSFILSSYLLTESATFEMSNDTDNNDLDTRLCPSYVYGFSLEKKEWCKFFVDSLSGVSWKEDALDFLILPKSQKRILQGLVSGHKFPDRARDELGLKGKGLVVLLHGVPGSGKTLTAGELKNPTS